MADPEKMRIMANDNADILKIISVAVVEPMERGMTGSITFHLLNGEIRACEINQQARTIKQIQKLLGGDE